MIDWLEDVLKAAESEAEQSRLLNLIAQMTGAVRVLRALRAPSETELVREKAEGRSTEDQDQERENQEQQEQQERENLSPQTEAELSTDQKTALREERIVWEKRPAMEHLPERGKNSDPIRDTGVTERLRRSADGGAASRPDGLAEDPIQSESKAWELPDHAATDSRLRHGQRVNPGSGAPAERVWRVMEQTLPGEAGRGGAASSALSSLYRRTAEAIQMTRRGARNADPVTIREERTVEAGITVRELDRAVRRDSRRYDGGMNIY